jgi:hypothetical protein
VTFENWLWLEYVNNAECIWLQWVEMFLKKRSSGYSEGMARQQMTGDGYGRHKQIVQSFGSHHWTTQQLWTATLILPDAPRCSQIGWVPSDGLSDALRLLHEDSSMYSKLWNRLPEYSEEWMVAFEMLQNHAMRMSKFPSYWEYWPHLQDNSSAFQTWSRPLRKWLLYCVHYIVQFNQLTIFHLHTLSQAL